MSTRSAEPRELLSAEDLAQMLQIAVKTLYNWSWRGAGPPAIRIGGRLRYDPEDVAAWVEEQKGAPRPDVF